MKTILSPEGKIMLTVDDDTYLNYDDPAYKDCTIVDGNDPLEEYMKKCEEEMEIKRKEHEDHEKEHEELMANSAIGLQSPIGLQDNRNELINGEFNLWQRGITAGVGFTQGFQNLYTADRWKYYAQTNQTGLGATAPDARISRHDFALGVPSGTVIKSPYYLNIFFGDTGAAADTPLGAAAGEPQGGFSAGTGAGNFAGLFQDIEDVRTLSGKSAILSFWAKSDIGNQRISAKLKQSFANGTADVEVQGYTGAGFTLDNTWRQYKTEFNVPSVVGQVIGTSGDSALQLGLYFHYCIGHGSPTNILGLTFEFGNAAGASGNVSIAQVQLEQGTNATEFDRKSHAVEITDCQRFYEKSYDLDVVPGSFNTTGVAGTPDNAKGFLTDDIAIASNLATILTPFATRKRAVPHTVHYYHPFNQVNIDKYCRSYGGASEAVTGYHAGESCISRVATTSQQYGVNVHHWHFSADAELSVTTNS